MTALARLTSLLAAVLLPVLPLAQEAGGRDPAATGASYVWVWFVAAAAVLAALFTTFFRRSRPRGPTPPARTP